MERMNRPGRRPRQRAAVPQQNRSPLRAVTDGEFKRREPPDLSAFRPAKITSEPDTDETPKAEAEQVAQGKSDSWLDTVLGALQGEFNDAPTAPELFLDMGIGMVPVAGEVTDLRDIAAVLIRMVSSGVYSEWGDWLTIALSSIGLVPVVGGFLKGFAKIARAGKMGDLVSRGDEFFALMSRFGLSAGSFRTQMMGLWSNATGQAVDKFNRVLDIINAASFRIFSGKIGIIREAGSSLLSSALDERGAMIDEAAAEVQRLLGGQGELAMAGGPSARRAPRPDAPDLDAQVMRMEGAGGGRLIGGRL